MKSSERIKLENVEWFNHFGISFYLLMLSGIVGFFLIQDPSASELLYAILIILALSIFFYWLNWNRLFFQVYRAELTDAQFRRAIIATSQELNWQIGKLEANYAEAFRFPEVFGIGGEKIIIKKTENRVFINSRKFLELEENGYSPKRNRENVNSFLINAANILKGKDVEKMIVEKQKKAEADFWAASEWTIGKILMRIIGYGLTMLFLLIGLLGVYEGVWEGIFSVFASIGISFFYIKSDIQIIIEKRRRKKWKKKKTLGF